MKRALGPVSHILAGLIPLAWAVGGGTVTPTIGLVVVIVAASLLPDIDSAYSVTGRIFGPLSAAIEHRFGHRTLTHSA